MKLIAKTTSSTGLHVAVASLVAFAFTGNWGISLGVAMLEAVALVMIHPLHEWVWDRALVRVPGVVRQAIPRHLEARTGRM